ncbi:tyrosine-type recombinase/integrase [Kitasatospora sp. NPDC018058]|uniref:tyrosine-type recombinase/integrase n=1 Tax=Kitasatospora sp. NPDC018058 TaxID=3364025 RepID=UPI0037BF5F21
MTAGTHHSPVHRDVQTLTPGPFPDENAALVALRFLAKQEILKATTYAGYHLPKIGLHDLRHTAASIMIAADIPLAIVSKTLHHSHLAITVDLYGHLLKDSADEAALHGVSTTAVIPNTCLAA